MREAVAAFSTLLDNEGWVFLVKRIEDRLRTIDHLMATGAGKLTEREFDCLLGERKGLQSIVNVPQKTIEAYNASVRRGAVHG